MLRKPKTTMAALIITLTGMGAVMTEPAQAHTITNRGCATIALERARAEAPATRLEVRRRASVCRTWGRRHNIAHWRICNSSVPAAIGCAFGPYASAARRVAWCESTWNVNASNGQYLGLFQMGSNERATYGHGRTALAQSFAARRYFDASGRDWSPWQCKP